VVIFGHFQRPSVAANLTIDEFVRAKPATDGRLIVLVSEHKTGAQGPAQLALEPVHHKLFSLYAKRSVTMQSLYISQFICFVKRALRFSYFKVRFI